MGRDSPSDRFQSSDHAEGSPARPDDVAFAALMERLAAEEPEAADDVVREFEPEIHRFIRFRLNAPQLRRMVETDDISQSVFARFFVDVRRGVVQPKSPDQLKRLLLRMARNKLIDQARRQTAGKRDGRRLEGDGAPYLQNVSSETPTPSVQLSKQELLERIRRQMSDPDFELVHGRLSGKSWNELAEQFGGTAEAQRKRFTRILESAARQVKEEP